MNFSFSEIRQLIENNSRDGVKKSLKFSFCLLLFLVVFSTVNSITVYFGSFDFNYFPFLFEVFKTVGVSETIFKFTLNFIVTLILYFILLWIIILMSKDFLVKRKYRLNIKNNLSDFDFQGNIVIDKQNNAIHIIQSELGCIVKNRRWKNFDMEFEFKIPKAPIYSPEDEQKNQFRRGFGIIYRAEELGKYYMLKIDKTGYLPHVRNILWENNGKISDTSISINDLDKWIIAKLSIRDNFLSIKIGKDNFAFNIPTHSLANRKDYPETAKQYGDQKLESLPFSKIPFHDYGSVGFRSAPFEEVYIRNLEVKEESFVQFIKRKLANS